MVDSPPEVTNASSRPGGGSPSSSSPLRAGTGVSFPSRRKIASPSYSFISPSTLKSSA